MKLEYKPEMLCYGLPDEFKQFFEYIRGVQFTERPDYTLLKGLFNKALVKLDYVNDAIFDWCKLSQPVDIYQNHVPKYDMFEIIAKLESLKKDNHTNHEFNDNYHHDDGKEIEDNKEEKKKQQKLIFL